MQHALNELCFACMVLVLVDPFPLVFFRSLHRHMLRISHVFELCHAYQSLGQDAHSARFAEICAACSVQASHSGFNRVVTCSGRTLDFGPAVRGGGRRRHIVKDATPLQPVLDDVLIPLFDDADKSNVSYRDFEVVARISFIWTNCMVGWRSFLPYRRIRVFCGIGCLMPSSGDEILDALTATISWHMRRVVVVDQLS